MGMDPKYCKVTVHPANIKASRLGCADRLSVMRSQFIRNGSSKRAPPPVPPYKAYAAAVYDNVDELQEDDTADIAVLSEEEPILSSRRRAHTTSSMLKQSTDSTTSASSTPDLMDTPPPLMTPPPMMDLANSFLDVDTDGSDEITRPTFEDVAKYETPPIPSHLRDVLLHNQNQQKSLSPLVFEHSDDEESEIDDDDASSTTDDHDEDPTNHSVDIDSIRQTRDQAVATFEASLRDPNRRVPRSRTTEVPKRVGGSARNIRGLSSPPRMLSQVIRSRKATQEAPSVPMYHGQELHLAFKTTTGQITQVQGHPKRRGGHKNPFSRRVRCNAIQPYDSLEDGDTLRIIGHTTEVFFAVETVSHSRAPTARCAYAEDVQEVDPSLLSLGPDRTPVTSTSKFYLQSVYDRKKTVGFLPSRRDNHPGCLAMYVHRNAEDKVEPIQFFKRQPDQNLSSGTSRSNGCKAHGTMKRICHDRSAGLRPAHNVLYVPLEVCVFVVVFVVTYVVVSSRRTI
ncbi:hypothetical protein GQ600_14320 [Phytophthora cactorum]|nr:hypothetical protein GQ600_14320 [Phytophthora cactorum]